MKMGDFLRTRRSVRNLGVISRTSLGYQFKNWFELTRAILHSGYFLKLSTVRSTTVMSRKLNIPWETKTDDPPFFSSCANSFQWQKNAMTWVLLNYSGHDFGIDWNFQTIMIMSGEKFIRENYFRKNKRLLRKHKQQKPFILWKKVFW